MGLFGNMQRAPLSIQDIAPMLAPPQQQQPNSYIQSVMQPLADPRSADLMAQQAKALQPGFFGKGGTGRNIGLSLLGGMLDGIAQRGGMTPGFATGEAWRRRQMMEEAQRHQERQDRMNTPSILNTKAGVMSVTPAGETNLLYAAPPEAPEMGETERLIQAWASLPDSDPRKPMYAQAVRGFQYSQPGIQAIAQAANARAGAVAAHRAPPRAGGGGGASSHGRAKSNPVPVNSKEALMAQSPGTWVVLPNGTVTQRR